MIRDWGGTSRRPKARIHRGVGRARSGAPGEVFVACCATGVALVGGLCWLAGGLASVSTGRGWREVPLAKAPLLALGVARHPLSATLAWPAALRPGLGGDFRVTVLALALALLILAGAWLARALGVRGPTSTRAVRREAPTGWATRRELAVLRARRDSRARLVLGRFDGGLVSIERHHSLLVVGPTQSGKTSGLALPALLEWDGPVVATSVKTDLLRGAYARRCALGDVAVFDPTAVSGYPPARWSPLEASTTWRGALGVAAGLCGVARAGAGGLEDAGFWYATAEKLLAPLLFAASNGGATMADVVRWVDTGETDEVLAILDAAGEPDALRAAEASFGREDRQRSSVYTTAETVLAGFADPAVVRASATSDFDPAALVAGGSPTLFLVAPAHEQARLQSVFVALLRCVFEAVFARVGATGEPLDPPLLVVLDEAANIAPLAELDVLASIAAGHGVQLLTVWQDFAQIEARYAGRAATVVNNHRAKLVCSGVGDPATLEHFSRLIGDAEELVGSTSIDADGRRSRSVSPVARRLVPADRIRRLAPGEAVLVYGHLPPARIALRPAHLDRRLRALATGPPTRVARVPRRP